MPVRTTQTLLINLFVLILISACGVTESSTPALPTVLSPDNSSSDHPTSDCENKLLPVVQGATWTYYSTGGPNGDFAYTDIITSTRANGFTLTSQFPNLTLAQEWLCTPEGLIAQQLGDGTTASVSMQNMITDFKTLEIQGVSLPKEITPSMQWNYNLKMEGAVAMPGESIQSPGTFALTMQEVGTETIGIIAGTFDAVKIQTTFNAQINVDFQGSPVPYTVNGSSILWYAPGVGFIKSIENIDFSGTTFTSNTELQSFNIP